MGTHHRTTRVEHAWEPRQHLGGVVMAMYRVNPRTPHTVLRLCRHALALAAHVYVPPATHGTQRMLQRLRVCRRAARACGECHSRRRGRGHGHVWLPLLASHEPGPHVLERRHAVPDVAVVAGQDAREVPRVRQVLLVWGRRRHGGGGLGGAVGGAVGGGVGGGVAGEVCGVGCREEEEEEEEGRKQEEALEARSGGHPRPQGNAPECGRRIRK